MTTLFEELIQESYYNQENFLKDITLGTDYTAEDCLQANVGWCKCGSDLAECVKFCYQCGEKNWNEDWDFQYCCRGCGEEKDQREEAKCDYDDYCYKCCDGRGCDCPTCEDNKKKCEHKWECGCEKEYCGDCLIAIEEGDFVMCEDESCKHYYSYRNDNCNCNDRNCGFCR
jgi:hypothetical protein